LGRGEHECGSIVNDKRRVFTHHRGRTRRSSAANAGPPLCRTCSINAELTRGRTQPSAKGIPRCVVRGRRARVRVAVGRFFFDAVMSSCGSSSRLADARAADVHDRAESVNRERGGVAAPACASGAIGPAGGRGGPRAVAYAVTAVSEHRPEILDPRTKSRAGPLTTASGPTGAPFAGGRHYNPSCRVFRNADHAARCRSALRAGLPVQTMTKTETSNLAATI